MMRALQQTSLRRAALALHAVADADRDWLLGALSAAQQAQLRLLLDELRDIGIPSDRRLVDELCAASAVPEAARVPVAPSLGLDVGQAAVLARLARCEPPTIVAALCGAADASWRNQLLTSLAPAARAEVQAQESRLDRAPALRGAILESVRRQLPAGGKQAGAVRAGLWQRVRSRLRVVRRAG
jgi:hypothetical protein